VEASVEERDTGVVELWIRGEPGGAGGRGGGGIGGVDAVGSDAHGHVIGGSADPGGKVAQVVRLLRGGGVPTGDGGEGARMDKRGGEAFFPGVVGQRPGFEHSARGEDERCSMQAGCAGGVVERALPEPVGVDGAGRSGGEMAGERGGKGERAAERAGDRGKTTDVHRSRNMGDVGGGEGDEADLGAERGLGGGERGHGARRAAVARIDAGDDVEDVEHLRRARGGAGAGGRDCRRKPCGRAGRA
jgi:hypothetical protein